ncbi:Tail-specific protease precursor [compost metagenome]
MQLKQPFIILTFIFQTIFYSNAGEVDSLSGNVNRLIKKIQKTHVKPRAIDASFGNQVHDYLVSFVDGEKEIFRSEDVSYLKELSAKLPEDFQSGKQFYFSEFERIFRSRSDEIKTIQKNFLSKALPLTSSKKVVLNKDKVDLTASNFKTFWEDQLSLYVFSEMVAMYPKDSDVFLKDSLVPFEKKARLKVGSNYANYFLMFEGKKMLQEMYLSAIAMSFDPHTSYFNPSEKNRFFEELSTQKEKFGISYQLDEQNRVVLSDILPGSSAWLSNQLFTGDQIVRVKFGWKSASWLEIQAGSAGLKELSEAFGRYEGKEISILVKTKSGEEVQVDLEKRAVYNDNDNIKNALLTGEKNIGYISLPDFYTGYSASENEQGCANDMAKCILKLKKDGIQGLILDLRGNGGGSLYEAVALSGIFIDYGPVLATSDNTGAVKVLKDINRGFIYDGPLMVLIDEGSASASEIVAAVLQDYKKALVVGVPSYGKATSQLVRPLDPLISELSALQENPEYGYVNITEGFLFRVNGQSNQIRGVIPDVLLGMSALDSMEQRERAYQNALVPTPIEKKMVYSPSITELPVGVLKNFAEEQRKSGVFRKYYEMLNTLAIESDRNRTVSLDFQTYWNESLKDKKFREQFNALKNEMSWNVGISSNSFDKIVYDQNPILQKYFEDFKTHLNSDIELFEAVGMMNQWLQTIK